MVYMFHAPRQLCESRHMANYKYLWILNIQKEFTESESQATVKSIQV